MLRIIEPPADWRTQIARLSPDARAYLSLLEEDSSRLQQAFSESAQEMLQFTMQLHLCTVGRVVDDLRRHGEMSRSLHLSDYEAMAEGLRRISDTLVYSFTRFEKHAEPHT